MASSKSAIAVALAKRFGPGATGRRNLLRTLGVTMDDLLKPTAPAGGANTAQPDAANARVADFKVELTRWLHDRRHALPELDGGGIVGRILALLDQEDDGAEDVGPDVEGFRKLLREKGGLSEAEIEKAIELAGSVGGAAKDRLPVPATKGGFGGYGNGVKVAADEATRSRVLSEMDELLGTGRVSVGFETRQPRRKVSVVTAKSAADFATLFPDAARIQTG
jgi:hypothetical protein